MQESCLERKKVVLTEEGASAPAPPSSVKTTFFLFKHCSLLEVTKDAPPPSSPTPLLRQTFFLSETVL